MSWPPRHHPKEESRFDSRFQSSLASLALTNKSHLAARLLRNGENGEHFWPVGASEVTSYTPSCIEKMSFPRLQVSIAVLCEGHERTVHTGEWL